MLVVVDSRWEGPACGIFVIDLLDRRFEELAVAVDGDCSSGREVLEADEGLLERRGAESEGPMVEEREDGGGLW